MKRFHSKIGSKTLIGYLFLVILWAWSMFAKGQSVADHQIQQSPEVAAYFLQKPGYVYQYDRILASEANGLGRFMENTCVHVEQVKALYFITYEEQTSFSESGGEALYAINKDEVLLMNAVNLYASAPVSQPKPVLRLPNADRPLAWEYNGVRFQSDRLAKLHTSKNVYQDVIVVTEFYSRHEKFRRYYAKGVGLVMEEYFNADNELVNSFSFELVAMVPQALSQQTGPIQ